MRLICLYEQFIETKQRFLILSRNPFKDIIKLSCKIVLPFLCPRRRSFWLAAKMSDFLSIRRSASLLMMAILASGFSACS